MKTRTQLWLVLLGGLAVGYGAGIYTAIQIHSHRLHGQPVGSPELAAAKERLAQLRVQFTDENTWVKAQVLRVHELEERQHKL